MNMDSAGLHKKVRSDNDDVFEKYAPQSYLLRGFTIAEPYPSILNIIAKMCRCLYVMGIEPHVNQL